MHHELEKFLAVVQNGSFTAAARSIHTSQPALTSAIKSLEKRYGAILIIRNSRPLKLTNAGRRVYESARRIQFETNNLLSDLGDLREGQAVKLKIGAIDSVATKLLEHHTDAKNLEIHIDNSSRLLEAVAMQRIDFALVAKPVVKVSDNLALNEITDEKFVLVSSGQLQKAVYNDLKNNRLIENFATYNPESTTFQLISAAAKDQGITTKISFVSTSPELIKRVVLMGEGVALLPRDLIGDELESGKLKIISGFNFARPIVEVHLLDKQLGRAQTDLLESLKQAYKSQAVKQQQ